ncbi:thioredoxin family protein [Pedobacter cryoconitis]
MLRSQRSVLLQFSATWCGPCRMLMPIINQVEQKVNLFLVMKFKRHL